MIDRNFFYRTILALTCTVLFAASFTYAEKTETTNAPAVEIEKTQQGATIKRYAIPSPSMKRNIDIIVVLPPAYETDPDAKFPVLYTLHGYGAPYGTYASMYKIQKAQKTMPMIVVCFNGDKGGWYIDSPEKTDSLFMTFFFDELIPYMDSNYRTISQGSGRAVTGFSMGGFGAINYMLTKPDMFDSASALSGAFLTFEGDSPRVHKSLPPLLGPYEQYPKRYADLSVYTKVENLAKAKTPLPPIYLHCGTEDSLIENGRTFTALLQEKKYTVENHESEGGHNWKFWHGAAPDFMKFHWQQFQKQ